jgi:hypothetical protein
MTYSENNPPPDNVRQEYTNFVVRWLDQQMRPNRMGFSSEATARKFADITIRGGSRTGTTHVLKCTQVYEEEVLTL